MSQSHIAISKRTARKRPTLSFSCRTALVARSDIPCYARLKLLWSTMGTCALRAQACQSTTSSTGASTYSMYTCQHCVHKCACNYVL